MNIKSILILTILLLSLPFVIADAEQYLTPGITRDNTYQQDGAGVWTGRASTNFLRSENFTSSPLVEDLDNDGNNEIIIIKDTSLFLYNYTVGIGLIEVASFNFGTADYGSTSLGFYQNPGLLDHDGDSLINIILFNFTHMLDLEYNGTNLNLQQNATTGLNYAGVGINVAAFPTIKCAQGNQWASGNSTCVIPVRNMTLTPEFCVLAYNLDENVVAANCLAAFVVNEDISQANTHLVDGDSDGHLEMYYRYYDGPNDYIDLVVAEVSATNAVSLNNFFSHNLAGSALFTDIIVSNLDGNPNNGLEITWGFTSDGTNWDAYTIDHTGAIVENSYCTALTCPEGEKASINLVVATDTTYCDFSGDVYYYVRNSQNNDPGKDIDTVHCISRFAGSGTKETQIVNTQNFTDTLIIHQASLHGTTGILTNLFTIQSNVKQSLPIPITEQLLIPVDYQQSGSLDIIGVDRQAALVYYDDAFTNQNVEINRISFDTANPICQNEILGLTLALTDDLNNVGYCHVQELNSNSTQKSIQSNTSFVTPGSITLNYFADEVGTFPLKLRCRDQFHTAYSHQIYTVTVINDTTACNFKGLGGGAVDYQTTNDTSSNQNFITGFNDALTDVGVGGSVMKGIIWLIAMMLVVGGIAFEGSRQGMSGQGIAIMTMIMLTGMLVLGWYFGMIGGVPLVLFALVLATVIGFKVFSNSANVTGGG